MAHTESWFMALTDFCSKMAANLFMQVTACLRMPEDPNEMVAYRATFPGLHNENRDSLGLLAATFTGRERKARELLVLPWTNVNAQYSNGNTPLILAVQGQNETLVRLLLEHPCINVNVRGLEGYTALMRACSHERPDVALQLLARPDTDVNMVSYNGTTALTNAIRCGNDETALYLLMRKDLDVNYVSRHGENALLEAIGNQRFEVARALLSRVDIEVDVVDGSDRTPLILASQCGYADIVRLLLFAGCDPSAEDDQGANALFYALRRCSRQMVQDLIEVTSHEPHSLMRLCRTVIRRWLRMQIGRGKRLKPVVDRFPRYEVPVTLKRFLAYDP